MQWNISPLSLCSGQVSCKAFICSKGQYATSTGTDTSKKATCGPCPSGRFSGVSGLKSADECNRCATGRYGASSGLTRADQCTACPSGKHGKSDGSASLADGCEDCEPGRGYQDQEAQVACKPDVCAEGLYAAIGGTRSSHGILYPQAADGKAKTQCASCPKGRYSGVRGLIHKDGCNKCPIGRYGTKTGQTKSDECTNCPTGRRGIADGQVSVEAGCELCKAGYSFQNEEGQVSCKISTCSEGKYATAGSSTSASTAADVAKPADCSLCPGGKYSSKTGLGKKEECADCPNGRWGATEGATTLDACVICRGGTFSNTSGATTARCSGLCPPGKYSDDAADKCSFCPSGRWGATEGAKTLDGCMLCRGGTYSNTPGATTAQCSGLCPSGKYSDDGYAQCTDCGQGKYQLKSRQSFCVSCLTKMTTLGEGSTTCVCEKESYMNGNNTCVACPDDITCNTVGSTLSTVEIKAGSWRPNNKSDEIYTCPLRDSCLGGNSSDRCVDYDGSGLVNE